jgi:predicted AAA+ superfamily ATPase
LEFVLRDFEYSMPVGRISFAFVEPMSFPEFLQAHGQERLLQRLAEWTPSLPLGDAAHAMAMEFYDRYLMTGGMPEVVAADSAGAQASECRRLQSDLIQTLPNTPAAWSHESWTMSYAVLSINWAINLSTASWAPE